MKIHFIDRHTGEIRTENPPAAFLLKFLYSNPIGSRTLLRLARKRSISESYGKKMDAPESVNKIGPFVEKMNVSLEEAEKTLDDFTSFNDFFYRKLKSGSRPVGEGLVSPGDGRLLAFRSVRDVNNHFIKGKKFQLEDFLKNDSLLEKYKDSVVIILRLAPNDYHRFHFPDSGIPGLPHMIEGRYYSVSPYALKRKFTKVFTENKRSITEFESEHFGEMLLIPIGATMVGSIQFTYTPGKRVEKAEEMGYFAFGGSTIVMMADPEKLRVCEDLLENTANSLETYVRMGETIAKPVQEK